MSKTFGKYEIMWQEGKMPMQQLAKELIEKGIISADLDYKSSQAVQQAIKYDQEQMEKAAKEKPEAEKRKRLPPLEVWLGKDIPMEELHKMGYSYAEMMELAYKI